MALAQELDLREHALGGLAAEYHRGAVEPAERAVRALAPPAPACGLDEQRRRQSSGDARPSLLEEGIEVRHRNAVEVVDPLRRRRRGAPVACAGRPAPDAPPARAAAARPPH